MNKKPKYSFDERIKKGYYLADYFIKTNKILSSSKPNQIITMQFFQRKEDTILCGIEHVLQLLKFASPNFNNLKIWALEDGSMVQPLEPVLKIEGCYQDFGWLEGIIDGILARNSSIATNSAKIVVAAKGKPLLNMNDRADLYLSQQEDGYASYIGGFRAFVSQAAISLINDPSVPKPSGTMPHALIQSFDGDILKATIAFNETFPNVNLVSLVDYNNDCVVDAIKVANHFGDKLFAIRLDTAGNLIDKTLEQNYDNYPENANLKGVNPFLVQEVRKALDNAGHHKVKIIVSSGFNAEKIAYFESLNTPVDIYGVGEAISKINISFTGDAVLINGKPEAKVGRKNIESTRLIRIQ
ncbi:nicotinate phosphoribosyltransferase [Williamsoniiplasma somnilux]|uniref:nicotinate phosphoribosyltransferase n=1 Tax=Williamsoniiplasma somnilux TaxID=215578 RepID=A0A2K8NXK9_9MOLU|nr:nicotinate phosphoribosyltransferase [Williamsoniiplasma somnilux]ATZ18572.1 nicotinate phosphoribosyltransferase [Williamsoniiplasma somnilux]